MTYNGHKNWAHWNVALWIGNDEPLYRLAKACRKASPTLDHAARSFISALGDVGVTRTDDGQVLHRGRLSGPP